ncbi:MAG: metallophosphoesterase family protein [Roseovarius sp.]
MTNELGARKFAFAVISDTHVNPDDDLCNSPFPVNARANRRFRHVIADLNTRKIEFVVHLGDLIHPVPSSGAPYAKAAQAFKEIAADLRVPLHILPGNHDIGDTPIKGAPSGPIDQEGIDIWQAHFGAQYGAFSHDGIRYVLLNAQLLNSGLPAELEQKKWIEAELAATQERVFLMLHHPAYICTPDETNHYDNTNAPAREWLLDLLVAHGVEAMFSGHAHNFWYNRYHATDYYLAPSTSFVRQDYAEMARATPPANSEFGRDDSAKLGYFIVTIYEQGHTVQIIRTNGAELAVNDTPAETAPLGPTPRENTSPLIGFDLRKNWAELTDIPPSGGLDEFDRKVARNDYHLLSLIEMGVRNVRVPLSDLRDPLRFERLKHLAHLGLRLTLFGYEIPSKEDMALVQKASSVLTDWEMTIDWSDFGTILDEIEQAHAQSGLPIYLSRMRSKADIQTGGTYYHVINHGFGPEDGNLLAALSGTCVSGAVFRLSRADPVTETLSAINRISRACDLQASVHLRTVGENPAEAQEDEETALQRVEDAMSFVQDHPGLRVFSEALVEVDRGYFPRIGAIDRNMNPTSFSRLVQAYHLATARPA